MDTEKDKTNREEDVKALYKKVLERDADAPGLDMYVKSPLSLEGIEADMRKSHEYVLLSRKKDFGKQVESLGNGERLLMGSSPKTDEHISMLKSSGINAVLNLDSPFEGYADPSWCNVYLNVALNNDEAISVEKMSSIFDFMQMSLSLPDTKLFIHSSNGMSRAPMVIVLFLMADKKVRLFDAVQMVLSKHKLVNPSQSLVNAELLEFVKDYKFTGPVLKKVNIANTAPAGSSQMPKEMLSVTDNVYVGKFLSAQLANVLKAANVNVIIDLNEKKQELPSSAQWFSHIHLPISDEHINEMMPIVIKNVKKYASKGRLFVLSSGLPSLVIFVENYVANLDTDDRRAVDVGDLRKRLMSL